MIFRTVTVKFNQLHITLQNKIKDYLGEMLSRGPIDVRAVPQYDILCNWHSYIETNDISDMFMWEIIYEIFLLDIKDFKEYNYFTLTFH